MRRISLVGTPGSGKTTVGKRLAARLEVPFIELDEIFHGPGWRDLSLEQFRSQVGAVVEADAWVVDGNYRGVQDLVWARADTVEWLDLPRLVVRRVATRTLRRAATRERLWNGNREPWSNFYRWDPEHNIVRWAWVKHANYVERYGAAMDDPATAQLRFVRLTSGAAIDRFAATAR